MGRSKLPDFDAERPPELSGLPILSQLLDAPGQEHSTHAQVALAFGERSRSRLRVDCVVRRHNGSQEAMTAGIVLARGSIIRGGRWVCGETLAVQVLAADEDLIEVRADPADSQPQLALLKAAYHLGNRHVPLQVEQGLLKLEYDYVLVDMLVAMGLKVQRRYGPFESEWGAYAQGHAH